MMSLGDTVQQRSKRARAGSVALAAVIGAGGMVGLSGPADAGTAVPAGCSHQSDDVMVTCTFAYTGLGQSFTVPSSVTSVDVAAWGGRGADSHYASPPVPGGRGGYVTGTVAVSPGEALVVTVGGDGASGVATFGFGAGAAPGPNDIRSLTAGGAGGTAVTRPDGSVLLVAGGGGGAGMSASCAGVIARGGAGGDAGANGAPGEPCGGRNNGTGGSGGGSRIHDGTVGGWSAGGAAGGGGGGGGGYRGGLGGGNFDGNAARGGAGGGGGGTSYTASSVSNAALSGLSDRALGQNGQLTISYLAPDSTSPAGAPVVSPAANQAGWVNRSPSVVWNWTDAGSGIDPAQCTRRSASLGDGIHTVAASCADIWANQGADSVQVKVDTTRPVAAPTGRRTPDGTIVAWNWTDATSGVDGTRCQQVSSFGSWSGPVTASCTDLAGNTATYTVTFADLTKPGDAPVVSPAPNAAGWNNTDVSLVWNWVDARSGVDVSHCTQQSSSVGDGVQTLSASCADLTGNVGSDSRTVRVDKTKPVDSPTARRTSAGITVDWNWTDATSGVDASRCQQQSVISSGPGTLTGSCTDLAGNTATRTLTIA